jgi:hypothetical protein
MIPIVLWHHLEEWETPAVEFTKCGCCYCAGNGLVNFCPSCDIGKYPQCKERAKRIENNENLYIGTLEDYVLGKMKGNK